MTSGSNQPGRSFGATRFTVTNVLRYARDMCDEVLCRDVLNGLAFQPSPYLTEIPKFDLGKITIKPFIQALYSGNTMNFAGTSFAQSSDCCPFIARRATAVRWDGELVPCLPLLHDHTSYCNGRERFSLHHSIGNVIDRPLESLWREPDYVAFRKTVDDFDFSRCASCGGCDLSEKNEEDCFANDFPTCGGCLWAQGIIQCP
jgi:MoaA/NifB/PqqE/SkfB family radical SAM enzyme